MMIRKSFLISALATIVLGGCAQTASWHSNEVASAEKQNFTAGTVQKSIRKGMPSYQVAEALGSPNIVTTDENGRQVWIYDKFNTETVVSGSEGLTFSLKSVGAGAVRSSQSTITVIIKYDDQNRVRDVAYHSSRF